ncbi:cytochrome-c oxidase, cbb3-type subunit I [Comamonas sp. JC664]|uniref:cytochrome-c oxidase, cbb3-type subunit I n=1 Tax=Comamonas sp. JC664 TaxID=2801917 RepID=UPI00174BB3C1|nr:cytochrome-c oxidase, cbb3-type subunit I [Comamonas sp. JC664]GHG63153.1 bifunctional cbb3-type cytochrome C oxidase subunit I/II [Comamonas sp. KCTC 72670]
MHQQRIIYDDTTVRRFILASVLFGIVGMAVGALVASQLAWWQANLGIPYTTYSRLRPLHTNAVIFAFVGNMMFAGIYYSTQRLLKTRMASDLLSKIHFWGWQLIIVAAAISLPLGITTSKEYAELEWPIDLAITVIWVVFAINFFWTLAKRHEKNLYVAIWFYIATIVTVAVLHIVNSLALPLSPLKSYSVFAGVQDALVQWWYGHNAVAFFLTTPILGIMYYFLPKAAERPVYSYRLSIIHFWALVFIYIWAGPHHLLYTALPDWAQSLGMIFSVMLWAPSWGGMLNGLLTLKGAWYKLREDPVLKFLIAGVTFYGMATFEGPLLSIKSVSALGHYTDWIVGHVHSGALGWNGFMAAGMFYWLVPRLYGTKLHSTRSADAHFWLGTVGILLYMVSMWISGVTQGLMWRAANPDGTLLYPNFVETLLAIRPMYIVRFVGGSMYLVGFVMMAWNLWKTARAGKAVDGETTIVVEPPAPATEPAPASAPKPGWVQVVTGRPLIFAIAILTVTMFLGWAQPVRALVLMGAIVVLGEFAWMVTRRDREAGRPSWFGLIEGRPLAFTVLTLIAILIGGVAELLPTIMLKQAVPAHGQAQAPYSPLELQGRDLYVREGCYTCHSQMIRPFVAETQRYGDVSRAEEFIYDHPFQWGSKRTGPDLHRLGGKYPNLWHYTHMMDPRATSPGSNMPPYPWLAEQRITVKDAPKKLALMQRLGVPYSNADVDGAEVRQKAQAEVITADLATQGVQVAWDSEMVAIIAYLQRLGRGPQDLPAPPEKAPESPGRLPAATIASEEAR